MMKGQKIVMFTESYHPLIGTYVTALQFTKALLIDKDCFTVEGVDALKFSLDSSNPYRHQLANSCVYCSSTILAFDDFEKAISWLEAFKARGKNAARSAERFILKIRAAKAA